MQNKKSQPNCKQLPRKWPKCHGQVCDINDQVCDGVHFDPFKSPFNTQIRIQKLADKWSLGQISISKFRPQALRKIKGGLYPREN